MNKIFSQVMLILAPSEQAYQQITNIPPLALGVLKGFLTKNGINTDIYDLNVTLSRHAKELPMEVWGFIYDSERIVKYLNGENDDEIDCTISSLLSGLTLSRYSLIGISLGADFSWLEMHGGMLIAKWVQKNYCVQIELGGNNVHYLLQFKDDFHILWKAILNTGMYICVGPGEQMLLEMVKMLNADHMDDHKLRLIPGAVWKEGDEVQANPQDVPSLSMPDFTGLDLTPYKVCMKSPRANQGQSLNEIHVLKWPQPYPLMASIVNRTVLPKGEQVDTLVVPYIFNYNCPYCCAFCVQSGDDKKRIIVKPTEVILNEIEELMQKYNTNFFYFYNNTFNYSKKFVIEFCEGVKQRGLNFYWSDCARFNNLDYDQIKMLYDSGCRKLVFGFETGSEKLLKLFDKRLDLGHAEAVLQWCKDVGIWADIEVIVGLPYEMEADFNDTVAFIMKNSKLINHFAMNRYFVVPDSLIGKHPSDYGIKLVRVRNRYHALLEKSYQFYVNRSKSGNGATNFQVYRYSEIHGRTHHDIVADTDDKIHRLVDVYSQLPIAQETKLINWRYNNIR